MDIFFTKNYQGTNVKSAKSWNLFKKKSIKQLIGKERATTKEIKQVKGMDLIF